jgi:hypothetical protein
MTAIFRKYSPLIILLSLLHLNLLAHQPVCEQCCLQQLLKNPNSLNKQKQQRLSLFD